MTSPSEFLAYLEFKRQCEDCKKSRDASMEQFVIDAACDVCKVKYAIDALSLSIERVVCATRNEKEIIYKCPNCGAFLEKAIIGHKPLTFPRNCKYCGQRITEERNHSYD